MPASATLEILVLDLPRLMRFLRAVAQAKAFAETTHMRWQTYDSTLVSLVYAIMFSDENARPGWVEVDTGTSQEVERRTNELTRQLWHDFRAHLSRGPAAVARVLRAYDQSRRLSLDAVHQQFADAGAINRDVIDRTRWALRAVATTKLAADVILTLPIGGWQVGLAYGISVSLIKDLEHAENGNVILFHASAEIGKGPGVDHAARGLGYASAEFRSVYHNARVEIAREGDLLRRRALSAKQAAKATQRLGAATTTAAYARPLQVGTKVAEKSLVWGFVAYNVYEAWSEYAEVLGIGQH
jgi:hypothetical protein